MAFMTECGLNRVFKSSKEKVLKGASSSSSLSSFPDMLLAFPA